MEDFWETANVLNQVLLLGQKFYTLFPYECDVASRFQYLGSGILHLFPDKVLKRFRCTELKMCVRPFLPYTRSYVKPFLGTGFEYQQVIEVARIRNISLSLVHVPLKEYFVSDISANGSAQGGFNYVLDGSADLLLGGFLMSDIRYQFAESLPAYTEKDLIYYVRKSELYPKWQIVIRPLPPLVWAIFWLSIFSLAVVLLFVVHFHQSVLLEIFGLV